MKPLICCWKTKTSKFEMKNFLLIIEIEYQMKHLFKVITDIGIQFTRIYVLMKSKIRQNKKRLQFHSYCS